MSGGFGAIGELPIGALADETAADAAFAFATQASQADTVFLVVIEGVTHHTRRALGFG